MANVLIGRTHRADADTDAARFGLSGFTTLIDVQPGVDDVSESRYADRSQCAGCNFVTFLNHRENLDTYPGLDAQRRFFPAIPDLISAASRRDTEGLHKVARQTGARTIREVLMPGEAPSLGLPVLQTVSASMSVTRSHKSEDIALVELSSADTSALLLDVRTAARAGFRRVYIGHARHARAMDSFNGFLERESFREEWLTLIAGAHATGIDGFGLILAFPPCASLQWAANRPLESLRARLDHHFRRLDAESSYMCSENVSGYTLTNDTRDFVREFAPEQRMLALRVDRVVLSYPVGDIRW